MQPSRRDLFKTAAAGAIAASPIRLLGKEARESFVSILREPDLARAFNAKHEEIPLSSHEPARWKGGNAEIGLEVRKDRALLSLNGNGVSLIQVRWRGNLSSIQKFLGDHWERSYADLEWRGEAPNRVMPWYFMATDGERTHGYGVKTHPKAMCYWMADAEGISLWVDVRSGGADVELGDRRLEVCEIVCREGKGESAFAATRAFCKQMCPNPRLPQQPFYGTNDWNFAYGNSSADLLASLAGLVSELSSSSSNRPFCVIDEGWQMGPYKGRFGYGPWVGNPRFGDMAAFAERLKKLGVRPGIWFRPLTPLKETPESWLLARGKGTMDPSNPEVLEHVKQEIRKLVGWGYQMIKHDFTSWDFFGRWGFQMGSSLTSDNWAPQVKSKTSAEILLDLYQAIRDAAGNAALIGCNTCGHLTAGTHELQRTGDDTSGNSWNRNRRMGVNTLAFRAPQHRTFFEVDPDIVSFTKNIPFELVDQWLRLVSESGTALFVVSDPELVDAKVKAAMKRALTIAAEPQPVGEPLDWLESMCPSSWKLMGKRSEFKWMSEGGALPFSD